MNLRRILSLAKDEVEQRAFSLRMLIMAPLLTLFILGACWGISDPDASLPSSISADTPFEVLFVASLFILLSATLGVVLFGFDGISRSRMSGNLAIELAQPIARRELAWSMLLGTWAVVAVPTLVLSIVGIILIRIQMGEWASFADISLFLFSTTMLLFWYAVIQMYASSLAKDMGSSIALGVAAWLLFTMVWLLVTVMVASILGVESSNTTDPLYKTFSAKVDLFSPNGVYHLLLETRLAEDLSRPISPLLVVLATALWTLLPLVAYLKRFEKLQP